MATQTFTLSILTHFFIVHPTSIILYIYIYIFFFFSSSKYFFYIIFTLFLSSSLALLLLCFFLFSEVWTKINHSATTLTSQPGHVPPITTQLRKNLSLSNTHYPIPQQRKSVYNAGKKKMGSRWSVVTCGERDPRTEIQARKFKSRTR